MTELNEGNTKENIVDMKEFMINMTSSSEEDRYQSQIALSVNDIIDTLSQSEPVEKLMDMKEKMGECEMNDCDAFTESIMSRMETFEASNTVDLMEM